MYHILMAQVYGSMMIVSFPDCITMSMALVSHVAPLANMSGPLLVALMKYTQVDHAPVSLGALKLVKTIFPHL